MASRNGLLCLTKHQSQSRVKWKHLFHQGKPSGVEKKAFSAVLCSSSDAKIPSRSDKTLATAASRLISVAATGLAVPFSSSSSWSSSSRVLEGSSQQSLPAFVPSRRMPIGCTMVMVMSVKMLQMGDRQEGWARFQTQNLSHPAGLQVISRSKPVWKYSVAFYTLIGICHFLTKPIFKQK